MAKRIGLVAGPLLFLLGLVLPRPEGLSADGQLVLGLTLWMAAWWMTEALPLGATSLLPLVILPSAGVLDPRSTAANYAEPTIFLFMGGFMLAAAFQKWDLHRRVAIGVLGRVGARPRRLLLAFMLVTAGLSMWISNTATAVMMLPIGLAVAMALAPEGGGEASGWRYPFRTVLMLAIAYAASIGGMATLVGTPPNLIFAGQSATLLPELGEVGFLQWMVVGLPLSLVFLAIAWAYLAYGAMDPAEAGEQATGPGELVRARLGETAPMGRGAWTVAIVFVLTVLAWMFRAELVLGPITVPGWATSLGWDIHDGTIAMAAALALFLVPTDLSAGEFVLDWRTAVGIPWEVLLLFGGGFALAAGFTSTGLATWMAGGLTGLGMLPLPLLVLAVCLLTILGGEVASNTAQTALILPVLAATAGALGLHPYWLMVPATLAASSGFVLPVATPPNAVAFASGYVTAPQMAKAGIVLDLVGAVLVTVASLVLLPVAFGV